MAAEVWWLIALIACGGIRRPLGDRDSVPDDAPPWSTEEGARVARYALIEALLDHDQPEAALHNIREIRKNLDHQKNGHADPELDLLQARAFRAIGLYEDAEAQLKAVLQRQRRSAPAYNELGILCLDQRRVSDAIRYFERAHRLDNRSADYANNLGFALMVDGQSTAAVDVLREALKQDATRAKIRHNLGFALIQDERPREAYRVFRSAMSEDEAQYNLGVGLESSGQFVKAEEAYTAALDANPDHLRAQRALKQIHNQQRTQPQQGERP